MSWKNGAGRRLARFLAREWLIFAGCTVVSELFLLGRAISAGDLASARAVDLLEAAELGFFVWLAIATARTAIWTVKQHREIP